MAKYLTAGIVVGGALAVLLVGNTAKTAVKLPQEDVKKVPTYVTTPTPTPTPQRRYMRINGLASYYSWDGCIGCHPQRIMANGEQLDDSRLTLAYNHVPMNTPVIVRNATTGAQVTATVTDTGGFEKLGRIADLSVATRAAIGCGHLCRIELLIENTVDK